jgi:hypothetical protein
MSDGIDHLIQCDGCSERVGRPIFRHKSTFRVGRRRCAICETQEELELAARLKTVGVEWRPSHGPKPLVTDEERMN